MSLADGVLLLTIFFLALVCSYLIARYAVELGLLDIPNARSFHSQPIPRGGGLGIAFSYALAINYLFFIETIEFSVWASLCSSGLLLLIVGYIDDRNHISARWRLLAQLIAVLVGLFFLGSLPDIQIFTWHFSFEWLLYAIVVFFALWWINLFNFMDGIDGIAAIQGLSILCSSIILIQFFSTDPSNMASAQLLLLSLVVSILGFLLINWSPARVFMGDAGSTFLAYALLCLALYCFKEELLSVWSWLILVSYFLVDASYTLIRRILTGQVWYEAHRSHAYQRGAQYLMEKAIEQGVLERQARSIAHRKICYALVLINIIWLLPMAAAAQYFTQAAPLLLVIACLPLLFIVRKLKAGTAA